MCFKNVQKIQCDLNLIINYCSLIKQISTWKSKLSSRHYVTCGWNPSNERKHSTLFWIINWKKLSNIFAHIYFYFISMYMKWRLNAVRRLKNFFPKKVIHSCCSVSLLNKKIVVSANCIQYWAHVIMSSSILTLIFYGKRL